MKYVCALAFFLPLWVMAASVDAASLYIDPPAPVLAAGDTAKLALRLDVATDECVNVVNAVVNFTNDIEMLDVSTGSSILSMWVQPPEIDKAARTVSFAGGIPNGYCGRVDGDPRLTNVVAELIVRAPGSPTVSGTTTAQIGFADVTSVLLNDGLGTAVIPNTYGAVVSMTNVPGHSLIDVWQEAVQADTNPPAPFSILLSKNPAGKYTVSFNTTDKQTGIDHYQVMEELLKESAGFTWGQANAPWRTERSPYELEDQTLNSTIYVKAVDKAGNERIVTFVPDAELRTLSSAQKISYGLLLGGLLLLTLITLVLWIFFRNRRRSATTASAAAVTTNDADSDNDGRIAATALDGDDDQPPYQS